MRCKKDCKEVVHFISPEMSALFDHAIVNMPDGSEKYMSITQPRKWRVKGNSFGATPLEAHKPLIVYDSEVKDGITVNTPRYEQTEVVYNSKYTGIDKRDQYWKDIKAIKQFASKLTKASDLASKDLGKDTEVVKSAQR